jgi:DNA-directed RNA polymerase specialized sigma subunit
MGLKFASEVDELNWRSVNRVLHNLPERDKDIIIEVFGRGDTLADNIYEVSKELAINQDIVWTLVSKVTNKIAKDRRLI